MTTNETIARWLGHTVFPLKSGVLWDDTMNADVPDYENSDAAAVTLLPVLVEKGYTPRNLRWNHYTKRWYFDIYAIGGECLSKGAGDTIAAAICATVMELIEKGE